MKSPFPGMDPYLEAQQSNVHMLMMSAITAALNAHLPRGLQAKPEEEIRDESIVGERLRAYRAGVATVDRTGAKPDTSKGSSSAAIAEPLRIPYQHLPIMQRNVQIVDTDSARIVTVIEVLSPWNKLASRLNRQYRRKLRDFEEAGTNWVEIDLLRGSRNRLLFTWDDLRVTHRGNYLVSSWRADEDRLSTWPISLRDRLPTLRIPLRESDEDVPLDLQAVLDRVYTEGRFDSMDYSKPVEPPLSAVDAKWTAELLHS